MSAMGKENNPKYDNRYFCFHNQILLHYFINFVFIKVGLLNKQKETKLQQSIKASLKRLKTFLNYSKNYSEKEKGKLTKSLENKVIIEWNKIRLAGNERVNENNDESP